MNKILAKLKQRLIRRFKKIGQLFYLTSANAFNNNIFESANSCSFALIFSFIPISLIIMLILVGLLKNNQNLLEYIITSIENVSSLVDVSSVMDTLLNMKSFSLIDFVLGIWIIWMARKLFSSTLGAINKIFKSVSGSRPLINQLFSFFVEFFLVIIIVFVMLLIFLLNQFLEIPSIQQIIDDSPLELLARIGNNASILSYIVIFIFTSVIYRMCSGVKPKISYCIFYAFLSTVTFYFFSNLLTLFFNPSNYNLIYGAISSLLILMMRVWFFFNIFLFFAQMLFCALYLDSLSFLLLYILPDDEKSSSKWAKLKRKLFTNPAVVKTKYEIKKFKFSEKIYSEGDRPDWVYYLLKGTVYRYAKDDSITELKPGSFFGEMHCVLNQQRTDTIIAQSDCEIAVIDAKEFLDLLNKDNRASSKAISKVAKYTKLLRK